MSSRRYTGPRGFVVMAAAILATACTGSGSTTNSPIAASSSPGSASASAGSASSSPTTGDSSAFKLVTPGTLTVATWGSSPPAIVIEGQIIGGLDGLVINQLAKDYGLNVKVLETDFAGVVLAVQQGKADMGTYFYWTAERSKTIFYPIPFIADYAVIVTKDPFAYTGPASLQGKKIGAISGSLYTPIIQKVYGDNVLVFPDHAKVGQALINGQVDAILEANSFIGTPAMVGRTDVHIFAVKSGDIPGLADSQLVNGSYNPVPCDHKALADAMDTVLQKVMTTDAWKTQMTQGQVQTPPGFELKRPPEAC